jgi:hypothetical protein
VQNSHIEESMVQLTVRCFIPEYLKPEARTVHWALGGPNVARTLKFTTGTPQEVRILGVQTTDERLFARLKVLEPGRAYEVELTAVSTEEPIRGYLRVNSDFPKEKPKSYLIPVSVGPLAAPRTVQYTAPPGAKPGSTPIMRYITPRPATPALAGATPVPALATPAPKAATPSPKRVAPARK